MALSAQLRNVDLTLQCERCDFPSAMTALPPVRDVQVLAAYVRF